MRAPCGAAHADRMHAKLLHRALTPHQKRDSRPSHRAASPKTIHQINDTFSTIAAAGGQRAVFVATRRCAALEQRADALGWVRLRDAVLRATSLAGATRQAVIL